MSREKNEFQTGTKNSTREHTTPNHDVTSKRTQQFLHLTYHSNDITQHKIREIYKQECEEIFSRELGISKFTIAYSLPSTIQSIIAKAKLFEVEGNEVSKHFMGEQN